MFTVTTTSLCLTLPKSPTALFYQLITQPTFYTLQERLALQRVWCETLEVPKSDFNGLWTTVSMFRGIR